MTYNPTSPEIEDRVQLLYDEWFPTRTASLADSQWLRDILLPTARKQLIKEAEMREGFAMEQINAGAACHA